MSHMVEWGRIRAAFTIGSAKDDGSRHYPTFPELSEQFGVPLSTIKHKAAAEKWTDERADIQQRAYEKAVAAYEDELARLLARSDLDAAKAASALIRAFRKRVEGASEDEQYTLSMKAGKPLRELLAVVHSAVDTDQLLHEEEEENDNAQAA